ncbi:hypothetical protein VP01_13829g1, partial [Puccinia sorghi]
MDDLTTSDYMESDSGHSTNSERDTNPNPSENSLKELVEHLLLQVFQGPKSLQIFEENHGIKPSAQTLTQNQKEWGIQQCDLQKIDPLPSLGSSFKHYLKKLNLKLLVNDVE